MADVLRLKSHFQKHDQHPRNLGHKKAERLRHREQAFGFVDWRSVAEGVRRG